MDDPEFSKLVTGLIREYQQAGLEYVAGGIEWYRNVQGHYSALFLPGKPDPLAPPEGYGIRPGTLEAPQLSDACATQGCRLPPDFAITMGCRNEHVFTLGYCAAHAVLHQRRVLECHARPTRLGEPIPGQNMICGRQLRIGKVEPVG